MVHRITIIGYTVFGVVAPLFWFIIIPNLKFWNPSRYTLGFVIICVATTNLFGLVSLIRKRDEYGLWLIATGLLGNGLSLFIIVFSLAGCFFLETVFRM
jgi:hypothetical protein